MQSRFISTARGLLPLQQFSFLAGQFGLPFARCAELAGLFATHVQDHFLGVLARGGLGRRGRPQAFGFLGLDLRLDPQPLGFLARPLGFAAAGRCLRLAASSRATACCARSRS